MFLCLIRLSMPVTHPIQPWASVSKHQAAAISIKDLVVTNQLKLIIICFSRYIYLNQIIAALIMCQCWMIYLISCINGLQDLLFYLKVIIFHLV